MEDLKGEKIVTWGKSNKDDRREVSPPPGFPQCTKPRLCDRKVSPPPGFPHCAKTDQKTDKGREKEVWKAPESKAIPHSATREKSSKCPLLLAPKPGVKTTAKTQILTNNKKEGAPIMILSKGKEKLAPLQAIKHLTQTYAKQTVDLDINIPIPPLYTISNKVIANATSGPSAESNMVEFDKIVNSIAKVYHEPKATSIALHALLLSSEFCSSHPSLDMIIARQKLSSLLLLNFHVLVDPSKLNQLVTLSNMLQNDTTLSANQLATLKLIGDIPSLSKDIIEIKELAEQVQKFFVDIRSNCLKARSLLEEHKKSMDKLKTLQAEVNENASSLRGLGDQIINHNAHHSVLLCSLEMKKTIIVELESSLQEIGNQIRKVLDDIKLTNKRKRDWEVKKKLLTERCNKVLSKFNPLKGSQFKSRQF